MVVNEYVEYYDILTERANMLDRIRYEYLMEVEQLNQEFIVNKNAMLEQAILEHSLTPVNEATFVFMGIFSFVNKIIEAFHRFIIKIIMSAISMLTKEKGKVTRSILDRRKGFGYDYVAVHKDVIAAARTLIFGIYYTDIDGIDTRSYFDPDKYKASTNYYVNGAELMASSIEGLCRDYNSINAFSEMKRIFENVGRITGESLTPSYVNELVKEIREWVENARRFTINADRSTTNTEKVENRKFHLNLLVKDLLKYSCLYDVSGSSARDVADSILSDVDFGNIDYTEIFNKIFMTLRDKTQSLMVASRTNVMFNAPTPVLVIGNKEKLNQYMHGNTVPFRRYKRDATLLQRINPNQSALYTGQVSAVLKKDFVDGLEAKFKEVKDIMSPANATKFEDAARIITSYMSSENILDGKSDGEGVIKDCLTMLNILKTDLENTLNTYSSIITGCNKVLSTYSTITTNIVNAFLYVNAKDEEIKEV